VRKTLIASFLFFLLFGYGLYLGQTNISVLPDRLEPANHPGFFDYSGITNVHSIRGQGSGQINDIITAGQEAGLDYLFITDLNQFPSDSVSEGYHRQLLVMSAPEYSYLDSKLFLYDLQRRHRVDSIGQAQVLLADLLSQSGPDAEQDLIILASPLKPGFAWSGSYPSGLDGIEIINLKSIWQKGWQNSKLSFLWSALVYPFNSHLALLRLYDEPQEEMALWDQLGAQQKMIGIAGADATAKTGQMGNWSIKFPSYETSFRLVSNHLLLRSELTGEAENDRRKIIRALSDGQFYISLDMLGNPKGFAAWLQDGDKTVQLGGHVKFHPGMKLVAHLPAEPRTPYEIAFFKDGEHVESRNALEGVYDIKTPGVYRVVVRIFTGLTLPDGNRWISWIYTNPIYVRR